MIRRTLWLKLAITALVALVGVVTLGNLGYRYYLAERPIPEEVALGPTKVTNASTDRVVLVIIDSLREDLAFDAEIMPFFNKVASTGASGVSITSPMTLTSMSVVTLGSGMTPPISWSLKNFDAEPFEDENVFRQLRAAGHKVALVGDASWTQLFSADADYTYSVEDRGWYQGKNTELSNVDQEILDQAQKILADPQYSVVVIHVVGTDKAAHKYGAKKRDDNNNLSTYARTCAAVDRAIEQLQRPNETWLIQSDHGCTLSGNHGGGERNARRAPFAWTGPGIATQSKVEQSMQSVAASMTALMGVRPPRTAEYPINFSVLTTSDEAKDKLNAAHLKARTSFVKAYVEGLGLNFNNAKTLDDLNKQADAADKMDQWPLTVGYVIGLCLMFGLMFSVSRSLPLAIAWTATSWLLIAYSGWQFPMIQLFGELLNTGAGFCIRVAIILFIGGLAWIIFRRFDERSAAWFVFAFICLALGQSVMRWPYGPLEETYRHMLVFGLSVWSIRSQNHFVGQAVLAILAFYFIEPALEGAGVLTQETLMSLSANGLTALGIGLLAWETRNNSWERKQSICWLLVFGLAIAAAYYQYAQATWLIKGLLISLLIPPVLSSFQGLSSRFTRNILIATSLILCRALNIDFKLILILPLAYAAWSLSQIDAKQRSAAAFGAVLVVLAELSYFYEAGYSYSFTGIDISVTFAATRDAINFGESFIFILCQHLSPWLLLTVAFVYNRVVNNDTDGLQAGVIALIGTFAIQTWGAFSSFGYEIHNHWFTMHAVPLIVFALCNVMILTVALACSVLLVPRDGLPSKSENF